MWTSMPRWTAVVLQRADHLEARAVADVREPRIAVAAEVALQDAAVRRAIEHRAPRFELADTRRALPCACSSAMRQLLRYCPPRIVSAKCTRQLSRSSTLPSAAAMPPSAMTVCALPSSDFLITATLAPFGRCLDGGAQAGAAGADDEDVVVENWIISHALSDA